jgi:hypothetical protein
LVMAWQLRHLAAAWRQLGGGSAMVAMSAALWRQRWRQAVFAAWRRQRGGGSLVMAAVHQSEGGGGIVGRGGVVFVHIDTLCFMLLLY